ncbi:MAG TPA: thioesterase family protein [Kiritimatiellia bacterium]|nr:thioesterase family protein [Kiritimatiellia bacterium]
MPAASPFEVEILVQAEDIDELGHVNNTVYLRWVQDAAVAHWTRIAPAKDQAHLHWVVMRHEIDYRAPARAGETVIARTWVGSSKGLQFERMTEILRAADRMLLAAARTIWCPIDAETGRPRRVSPEVRSLFSAG